MCDPTFHRSDEAWNFAAGSRGTSEACMPTARVVGCAQNSGPIARCSFQGVGWVDNKPCLMAAPATKGERVSLGLIDGDQCDWKILVSYPEGTTGVRLPECKAG